MPRSSPLEHLTLRRRPPRRLALEQGALLNRGFAELKPRRISYPKLAATAVRQLAFKSLRPTFGAVVLMPANGQESDLTMQLLPDVPHLTLGAAVFPALLDQLATPGERRVVCVLGDGETPRGEAHAALARSLAAHNPQIEQRLAAELLQRLKDAGGSPLQLPGFDRERLVVEEKPGKAMVLGLGETTLKLALKRWQALATRSGDAAQRQPVDAPDGWGVGAFVMAAAAEGPVPRGERFVRVASIDVELAGETVDLDTGRRLAALADAWLTETAGFGLAAVRRIGLSVPWMAVASTVGAAFASIATKAQLAYPDLLFGWQPFLSLMEVLYQPELPALFVYTGRHPEVHLVAVWV